ncbi:MAG: DUF1840 domain-containing protein [Betaproteobacteria bacterium]|nr:DUF1840 domain-containing protein [Betaproteobacteria bacterium]
MIYKFKSKATADLIMLEPTGKYILGLLHKDTPQGIVTVAEMPQAIAALEAAIADDERQRKEAEAEAARAGHTLPAPGITLRTRAWPFIDMLRTAMRENADVTWGV